MDDEKPEHDEALRLRIISEQKYNSSNLKSALKYAKRAHLLNPNLEGLSEMLTAFKILRVASKSTTTVDGAAAAAPPLLDWYKILQVEPFSHLNTIKKQYKKLALTLHPDKNRFVGSEEAFKLVGEAFRVMSDKIRRKEYDLKLRIAMQSAATEAAGLVETFWTACSTCRLLHQFDRKYLGHKLMCPSCKKSFKAMEVSEDAKVSENVEDGEEEDKIGASSDRVRARNNKGKRKMSSVGDVLKRSRAKISRTVGAYREVRDVGGVIKGSKLKRVVKLRNVDGNGGVNSVRGGLFEGLRLRRADKRIMDRKETNGSWVEASKRSRSKRMKTGEEMMTLAEMKMLVKRKVNEEKMKLKEKEKEKRETRGVLESGRLKIERRMSKCGNLEIIAAEKDRGNEKEKEEVKEKRETRGILENGTLEIERRMSKCGNLDVMAVEDSDFYDFDKDRVERSFKKGQVWAIYDDGDGMPRHYGLIDVVSVNPFEVKLSWLDLQNNGDAELICWEKFGFHISCGRFKVSKKTSVNSLNIFSHLVNCERAAREVYRIYPKKGSVWALYNENALDADERQVVKGKQQVVKGKQRYDIVIFLTSYSEMHGLSMAYLEKVDGFKAVFKRREIGCHAIRWLEKEDVRLFSHQIPARKLSREEVSSLSKDCWELDPASLPPELLTIGWGG